MKMRTIRCGPVTFGPGQPLVLIAGPCVIESRAACLRLAQRLAEWSQASGVPLVFKASYDKANRTSLRSFRGPGLERGLEILAEIKAKTGLPILTDVHGPEQVAAVAAVADILQVPAFLCRQTDLLVAAGASGRIVNIKKGQFLAPGDMRAVVGKVESTGNRRILLTERGASFGYNNLVADFRSLLIMSALGYPVIFDATHAVQHPGGAGDRSGGDGCWAPALARAAVATGCQGLFIETHPQPARALSDGPNSIPWRALPALWDQVRRIHAVLNPKVGATPPAKRSRSKPARP
ncbi:MAG: 3-deoxy-8-phosphooctulonate synthase [Candidatus Marinimicrobia bacterium]|nr:3-deoxy-8-phosphooctulonate synthase [Candidatus Neomarinimicrobiota bacterium]